MKIAKVEIQGISGLLMNNPVGMLDISDKPKKTTGAKDVTAQAEKLAYRKDDGELYVSAEAIKGCLVNAASYKKIGKYAAKPLIAAGVFILPSKIGLGTKKYDLDIRTVVIQRARVVKARPHIPKWKLSFEIQYDETLIGDGKSIILPLLEEGGKRVGILDFRPAKLGSFGMFTVTSWKDVD